MAMPALDLPLIWAAIIVLGVIMYVLLDGFDLGVGILFPYLGSDADRDVAMNSVAPIWDGNETWLVLGGAGLFAAFPLAYAVILPGTYLPLLIMLIALIFRGVAFEFRFKAATQPPLVGPRVPLRLAVRDLRAGAGARHLHPRLRGRGAQLRRRHARLADARSACSPAWRWSAATPCSAPPG